MPRGKQRSGKKPHLAKKKYRERWNNRHLEGRKIYALRKKIKMFKAQVSLMERKLEKLEQTKKPRE